MTKIEILSTIPRCGCQSTANFMLTNKKTGEKKFFCELCGKVHVLSYCNDDWNVLRLM